MKILIGITGSVGAKLTDKLINAFKQNGHQIRVVATESAKQFTDFGTTQENEFLLYKETGDILHIELAKWADVYLICPCTSNTLNKILLGISDNLVLSTLRAFDIKNKKVFIAPVMNTKMLEKDIHKIHENRRMFTFIWPTVKKLACGDFGLGAMPEIEDIVNIVEGKHWVIRREFYSPALCQRLQVDYVDDEVTHPGWFGAIRKHDIHCGVDLYCNGEKSVYPFEAGEIIKIGLYTGSEVGSPWWYESYYIAVEGKSGIIIYGEVSPTLTTYVGKKVDCHSIIGNVVSILKHEPKTYIVGHSMYMLHVEILKHGTKNLLQEWKLGEDRPKKLKDPTPYIYNATII